MAATDGLVALDPMALAALEATLCGVAEVYRRRAGEVADVLAGTGESAAGELAELRRVVAWCEDQGHDIARRRRLLGALPGALPLPAWTFETRSEAVARADAAAARLARALDRGSPSWADLDRALAQVRRGSHDGAFAARLLTVLGPDRAALLPLRLDQAARAVPGGVPDGVLDEVQASVAEVVRVASRHDGPGRLTQGWMTSFAGLDGVGGVGGGRGGTGEGGAAGGAPDPDLRARLEVLGFGADLARALALGLGAGRVALVVAGADKVLAVARTGSRAGERDGWDMAATGVEVAGSLGLLLVGTGIVSAPLGVAALLGTSVVASALGWFLRQVDSPPEESATPENHRRRHSRAVNPDTGVATFPGGGTDQPRQDGAGGVLPPHMAR